MMQIRPFLWIVTFNLLIHSPASASLVVNDEPLRLSQFPAFSTAPKIELSDLSSKNWIHKRSIITLEGQKWILDWTCQHIQPITKTFPNHTLKVNLLNDQTSEKKSGNLSFASYEVTVTDKKTGKTPKTIFEFFLIAPNQPSDLEIPSNPMYKQNHRGKHYVDTENDSALKRPHSL